MDVVDMFEIRTPDLVKVERDPIKASEMSLRDHFAGLALQAYINLDLNMNYDNEDMAKMVYATVDAMLKERLK